MSSLYQDDTVARLLEAAARAVAGIGYCWLATPNRFGLISTRPMGRLKAASDDDEWLIRFVTDDRSRKISEIRRGGEVTLIFQREADDTYISMFGEPTIRPQASADRRLWREAYEAYFPAEGESAHAAFLEVRVERMELWIRGVTPEPFGLRPTRLDRDAAGHWRAID
jgi:general stress protein 26